MENTIVEPTIISPAANKMNMVVIAAIGVLTIISAIIGYYWESRKTQDTSETFVLSASPKPDEFVYENPSLLR